MSTPPLQEQTTKAVFVFGQLINTNLLFGRSYLTG